MSRVLVSILAILFLMMPTVVSAQTQLTVTKGQVGSLPIAITNFEIKTGASYQLATDLRNVVEADLTGSGLFRSLNAKAFIQNLSGVEAIPEFASWRQIGAQAIVTASVSQIGDNITVQMRLWDVPTSKQFAGKSFSASTKSWRRLAHKMADEVYTRMTGEGPYFDTRIVYIAESGTWKNKKKQLAIMDQDGANHKFLTSGRNLVLTPRFDKQAQRIIYFAYHNKKPRVYLYDLETGREELLGNFTGMSFAPRFSHDGRKAVMSVSKNGNSDIHILDIATRRSKRITSGGAIDTSPSFSPDDRQIVFNSDRGGSQQLYTMNADGSNVKRISFGKGSYATPVWSPRGDLIAFTKMTGGKFHIGVMKPDGSRERLLTTSYLDEGPTWAPNGRVIMFARKAPNSNSREGRTQLYSVDLTGRNEKRINTPLQASDPAWSPLLP